MADKIKEFMKKQGKEMKDTAKVKPEKSFKDLKDTEKWALVEALLRDLKYID